MKTTFQYDGKDIFISQGERMHRVYPAYPGAYWFDIEVARGGVETQVLIVDDFGNMVQGMTSAHQRAHFRKVLH